MGRRKLDQSYWKYDGCPVDFVDSHPDFMNSFRFTKSGDEMIVQMALINYVHPEHVKNTSLRFVDFQTGPEDPRILRLVDYERIIESGMLFARKADSAVDNAIIDKLYEKTREH